MLRLWLDSDLSFWLGLIFLAVRAATQFLLFLRGHHLGNLLRYLADVLITLIFIGFSAESLVVLAFVRKLFPFEVSIGLCFVVTYQFVVLV